MATLPVSAGSTSMDDSNTSKGQRPRLTCTECYRRKIKCDKNVPCSTCIKSTIAPSVPPPAYYTQALPAASEDIIRTLLDRVGELEAKLQEQNASPSDKASLPHRDHTPASPRRSDLPSSPPGGTTDISSVQTTDAATVLEFLAWGRKKDADYGTSPEHNGGPRRFSVGQEDAATASNILTENSRDAQLDVLEALLPSRHHLLQLVEYHNSSILWYHGSYSSTIFNEDLNLFLAGYEGNAIATLTIAAHTLGKSSSQSVLLASAGRIAQSLGLHRLGPESEVATTSTHQLRQREAGRRVFNQLCTQDWFQIPFSESYSLNPRFFQDARLLNCNDDDMIPQPLSTPTQASYCNYRYDIAALMPQLLDAMASCNTLFTKYEQVLQYDEKMRKLATACMPTFLSTNAPVANNWPVYVGWARRSLTICASHKIIMIHRKFLGLSFTNSAFSFTRRTCIAASKTILKEALSANDEQGPVLWIEQAFSVAAGIILGLDLFHRAPTEKEFGEHNGLVEDAIEYLKKFEGSRIASRGVQLKAVTSKAGNEHDPPR
ncbi:hypothetical protein TW65_05535 [Stemphylium lycopersici]|uniref:Zn(2)-C6 fungal-type domain-containing protein n=1 Tax=Stemphylium lycopersici TaxID=183478 RepID=A0A364MUY7_STELY|nr:hypothetical protein TW65_05535 [Stemphylium lycopersici]RAR04321.1 hypothetical protein DDE83_007857 [Stemphylium lycopersici]